MIFRGISIFAGWFLVVLTSPCAIFAVGQSALSGQFSFNLAPRYASGLNAVQTAYSDLDEDGFLDIITVNGGQLNPSPTINIAFGMGNGGFAEPIVIPSYLIGHTVTAGDLNHDGRPDIVIAGWYHNRIAVFLNQGSRQFASPWITAPPDPPYPVDPNTAVGEFFDLAIADFDGDGNNDVVALQDQVNQRLRFFHFSGQGALTVFATLDQIGNQTSYERKMAVGDVNSDNRADIVFAGGGPFGARTFCFVFGQPAGGTLSMTYGWDVADRAEGIGIKDLDNDGDRDLAVAFLDVTTPTRHSVQVFRNNGGSVFTALPKIFLEYPFEPNDITVNDFDSDGKQDFAALIGTIVMVAYGIGDGTFSEGRYYLVSGSSSIFSADVNQDTKVDLLTASRIVDQTNYIGPNTVSVVLNNNLRRFIAPLVTLWGPNFIAAGDLNSDGYKDYLSSWETTFSTPSGVDVLLNDRAGGLMEEVSYESPAGLSEMKVGDFNADGKIDAVSSHAYAGRGLAVYFGNGTGILGTPVSTPFSESVRNIVVGDFNGDLKDDVFAVDYASRGFSMLSAGNGSFSIAPDSPITLPSSYVEMQKGDFNRDGKLDLVLTANSEVKLWLGDGAGRFTQSSVAIPYLRHIVPGDFNDDGKLDLVGQMGYGITGILGDGSGGFGSSFSRQIEGTYSPISADSIITADFDLDGFDDVALSMADNPVGNLIVVLSSGGAPSWRQPVFYGAVAARTLLATDFNGDGKPDLGYLGANARGVIYNSTARSTSTLDFDGDGKTDIGIFRPAGGEWWINRSSTGVTFALQFGASTDRIAPADYTGDGKADIAFFRPASGEWYVLRSEDFSFFALPFGADGDIPAPADYDADGKADFAVFRPSNATWFISQSSGAPTRIFQFGVTGDQPVVSDYDADGKADVGIFRPSAGEWWIQRSTAGLLAMQFGNSTDKAVQGDYTGDGKTDVAIWRPSTGEWFIVRSEDFSFYGFPFGANGDVIAPGDYDGDGKTDPTVFRPSSATWFIARTTAGTQIVQFGANGDRPIPNAFVP